MSRAWLCAIVLLLASHSATAAGECAGLSGAVSAASGEPAPLAELTLVNLDSGVETQVVADRHGKYQILRLPAGRYAVTARAAHTSVSTRAGVVVTGGPCVELSIILSTMPAVLESGGLREVPLNGRNYLDLLSAVSDATRGGEGGDIEGFGPYAPRGNSSLNSYGQRGQNNNFLIDGMDNNESWLRGPMLSTFHRGGGIGEPPGDLYPRGTGARHGSGRQRAFSYRLEPRARKPVRVPSEFHLERAQFLRWAEETRPRAESVRRQPQWPRAEGQLVRLPQCRLVARAAGPYRDLNRSHRPTEDRRLRSPLDLGSRHHHGDTARRVPAPALSRQPHPARANPGAGAQADCALPGPQSAGRREQLPVHAFTRAPRRQVGCPFRQGAVHARRAVGPRQLRAARHSLARRSARPAWIIRRQRCRATCRRGAHQADRLERRGLPHHRGAPIAGQRVSGGHRPHRSDRLRPGRRAGRRRRARHPRLGPRWSARGETHRLRPAGSHGAGSFSDSRDELPGG